MPRIVRRKGFSIGKLNSVPNQLLDGGAIPNSGHPTRPHQQEGNLNDRRLQGLIEAIELTKQLIRLFAAIGVEK